MLIRCRLDQEIQLFYRFARPTEKEQSARNKIIADIHRTIEKTLPGCQSEIIGSHKSGMSMTVSDIDIRLFRDQDDTSTPFNLTKREMRKQLMPDLGKLLDAFQRRPDFKLAAIRHSRFPLISTLHEKSGIDVQIVCVNDKQPSRDLIQKYLFEDPDLFPLFSVVKMGLEVRGLSDVFRGGLNSYSLVMMIVASLKIRDQPSRTVGQKLMDFLSLYGNLDLYKNAIAVEPPAVYEKIYPGHDFTKATRNAMRRDPVRITKRNSHDQSLTCF